MQILDQVYGRVPNRIKNRFPHFVTKDMFRDAIVYALAYVSI